jgi:putative ABC transport system permease protein
VSAGTVPYAALRAVARWELGRRWRSLLVLGLIAGLVGSVVVGVVAITRRTATAYDRLERAVHVEDVRVLLFDPSVADEIAALPSVRSAWEGGLFVGKVGGDDVRYIGILSGPSPPPDLFTPVVVHGRAADPAAPDEAVVLEQVAREIGVHVGDELDVRLLLPEEVAAFDTGFGEPDGSSLRLRITGEVRTPAALNGGVVIASPAFFDAYRDQSAGASLFLRLDDAPGARAEFASGIEEIRAQAQSAPGGEEFDPVQVIDAADDDAAADAATRVMVGGLVVFAGVAAVVGALVLMQVFARHHAASVSAQRVEEALGLTSAERVVCRVIPASLTALVASLVTFTGAVLAGGIEAPGSLRRVEPHPGFAPNLAIAAVGAVLVAIVTLVLAATTTRRAGLPAPTGDVAPSRLLGRVRTVLARPWAVAGVAFALGGTPRRAVASTRSSLAGAVVGVVGVVASLTFGASLDRLAETPERYGWSGDLAVVDVTEPMVEDLLRDERFAALTIVTSATVDLDGTTVSGYAFDDRRGHNSWTALEGRAPERDDEIMLGSKLAERLGREVGDAVQSGTVGNERTLTVVGIGIGPQLSNEKLGETALVTPTFLASGSRTAAFTEAYLRVAAGVDVDALTAEYASRYEVSGQFMPTEVRNVVELGRLPEALAAFLAFIALAAIGHALVVTATRRDRDVAVLRAMGMERRGAARAVAAMAVTITGAAIVVGIPVGYAVGRLVWWAVADGIGVDTDAAFAVVPTIVALGALAIGVGLLVAVPARRVSRRALTLALRTE